jgi:broad specificity phosphatase PhoE
MAFANEMMNWNQCREDPTQQLCGVIRHTERADSATAFGQGDYWHRTDDMKKWPLDPPLSENGVLAAEEIGHRVTSAAQECGVDVNIVVSSPYLRCIQTAVEVCHALGPSTRLLVDFSLGELYGPMAMGLMEPNHVDTVHPMEHTLELCRARGVDCKPQFVGRWPTWPETLRSGRRRFANHFLTYLGRGQRMRQNFLMVSHGDCVGAALSMMPSEAGFVLEKVDFGGMFLAQRQLHTSSPEMSPQSETPSIHSDIPASQIAGMGEAEERKLDANAADLEHFTPVRRMSVSTFCSGSSEREGERCGPPQASDGWQVQSYGIKQLHAGDCQSATLAHRLKDLIDNESFPPLLIEQLLIKQLSDQPLDTCEATPLSDKLLIQQLSDPQPLDRQKTSWSNVDREAPIDQEQPSKLSLSDVANLTDSSLLCAGAMERRNSKASVSTCCSLGGLAPKDCGSDTDTPATKMVQLAGKPCMLLNSANSKIALRRQRRSTPACADTFVTI